jgi:hypothetical protein
MRAFQEVASRTPPAALDPNDPYAAELALVARLKDVYLLAAGAAGQRFREGVKDEQEVLLALADVAIQIFAVESAVLRAARTHGRAGEQKRALAQAAVKVLAFDAAEKVATAARRAAFFVMEGEVLKPFLSALPKLTAYDASGLLGAKRKLADAALEAEKYVLAP